MPNRKNGQALRELLTVGEVAAMLSIHPNTVRRWASKGLLKPWRIGPRVDRRFLRTDAQGLMSRES